MGCGSQTGFRMRVRHPVAFLSAGLALNSSPRRERRVEYAHQYTSTCSTLPSADGEQAAEPPTLRDGALGLLDSGELFDNRF